RLGGVLPLVEVRGREVLRPVESELAVTAKLLRDARQPARFPAELFRQPVLLPQEDLRDIVDPRRLDPEAAEKPLERELHDLLRFAHHVRPAAGVEENLDRFQPHGGAPNVVPCKVAVPHLTPPRSSPSRVVRALSALRSFPRRCPSEPARAAWRASDRSEERRVG